MVRTDKGGKEESIVHRVVKPCESIGNVEEQQNLFNIACIFSFFVCFLGKPHLTVKVFGL